MQELTLAGVFSNAEFEQLSQAYIFQRRLIDALRMVRGHAKDLTVPAPDTEEFLFLARRLGDNRDVAQLQDELATHFTHVPRTGWPDERIQLREFVQALVRFADVGEVGC